MHLFQVLCTTALLLLLLSTGTPASATPVIMGDSLSAGDESWPNMIPGWDGKLVNLGVGGSSTEWWCSISSWWEGKVSAGQEWYILLGSNDAGSGRWWNYRENMEELIGRLLDFGVEKIVIIGSPLKYNRWKTPDELAQYDAIMEWERHVDTDLADKIDGVFLGPDLRTLMASPDYFIWDGTHFNQAGHEQVAAHMIDLPEPTTACLVIAGLSLVVALGRTKT